MRKICVTHAARHRRCRDDSSVPSLEHLGKHGANGLERSGQIDINHVVPGVVVEFVELPVTSDSSVGDTDIDRSEFFNARFNDQTNAGGVTDIGGHGKATLSGCFHQGDGLGQFGRCP